MKHGFIWGCMLGALMCAMTLPRVATADTFPSRPIKLMVGFPPGGIPDVVARQVARELSDYYHTSVVVDNRPGAGGEIAAEVVAQAPSDGYTLLLCDSSIWAINPYLFAKLPYDPLKDLTPIGRAATSYSTLVVSTTLPVKDLGELVAYAKQNPGKVYYSSNGVGSMSHLAGELFRKTAGVDIVHVPYKGAAPAVLALVSGEVQMGFVSYVAAQQGVAAGKLRILGVGSARRSDAFPDIPTLNESLPGFEMQISHAVVGPAGIPAAIVDSLNVALTAAVTAPATEQVLKKNAIVASPTTPAQLRQIMNEENAKLGVLVKQSGAHID